jgi:CRP-like cAMP-binding protein
MSALDRIETHLRSLPADLRQELDRISVIRSFKKGDFLVREAEYSRFSYFILSGIARKYLNHEAREITTAIYLPDDLVLSFGSYTLQSPSKECIQALTDVVAQVTHYDAFEKLKKAYPEFITLDLLLTEYHALWLEERLMDLYTLDASGRYEKLLKKEPKLLLHVPLGYIASYLGISQETLSRIRSR